MTARTHTAIAMTALGQIDEIQLPTPNPGPGQVLIKVAYAAVMAVDIYMADFGYFVDKYPVVPGFGVSGTVEQVGEGVGDFKPGDRVLALVFGPPDSKATQQYCLQPSIVCAKIPDGLALDAAATIPDNFVTAFYTLFNQLQLPVPSSIPSTTPPPQADIPILIYGAGSTAGQYSIQLLHAAGYTNVLATASPRHHSYIKSLGARDVFDYNSPTLANDIIKIAGGKVKLVLDSISAEGTLKAIAGVVDENEGVVALLLPVKKGNALTVQTKNDLIAEVPEGDANPLPQGVKVVGVKTFFYQQDAYLRDNLMSRILPKLLEEGVIQANRVRLMDKGPFKERVVAGLDLLRNGQVSGEKVVVKVEA